MTHCPLALKYKFTMNLKSTLLLLLCLMMAGMVAAKDNTKVIAHRGYWKTEGSAQNSIRSLERASEIGAYGSEFDVHLTADNVWLSTTIMISKENISNLVHTMN